MGLEDANGIFFIFYFNVDSLIQKKLNLNVKEFF